MVARQYSSTAVETSLVTAISSSDTVFTVASASGFPASTPFTLVLDPGTATEEIVTVQYRSGTTIGHASDSSKYVLRGQEGTAASAHSASIANSVKHMVTGRDLQEAQNHIDATTGVHGLPAGVEFVGRTNSQELTGKTINGSSNTLQNVPQSAVSNLVTDLSLKAPLASPTFTGTPTAPTATAGTNTTQLATTAFVQTTANTKVAEPSGNGIVIKTGDNLAEAKALQAGSNITISNADGTAAGNIIISATAGASGVTGFAASNPVAPITGSIVGSSLSLALSGTRAQFNTAMTDDDFVTLAGTETLINKTLTSPNVTNPTVSGLYLSDSSIVFEGSSADASETTLQVSNPTADRTITLPDASGTVALVSDSGTLTSGVNAATGWSIVSQSYRKYNNICSFTIVVSRTGADISINDIGNIPNADVATMPSGYRPTFESAVVSGANGRVAAGYVNSTGTVAITAVGRGYLATDNITTGTEFTLNSTFIVA